MPNVGVKGQLLKVRAGFYRNFLLPMGKAQLVTPDLLKYELLCHLIVYIFFNFYLFQVSNLMLWSGD